MSDRRFIAHDDMVRSIGPVTKRELDQLRETREKPTPTLELTPGGATEQIIRRMGHERATIREAYVTNRLERMEGVAANDFGKGRVRGKVRHDFERER